MLFRSVGIIERRNTQFLGLLHHRRRANREIRAQPFHDGEVVFQGGTVDNLAAVGVQPVTIPGGRFGLGARRADVWNMRTGFDQQTGNQKL